MHFKWVWLGTDILLYILWIIIILVGLWMRKNQELNQRWKIVFYSPIGVISAIILSCYIIIGLLDSIHYRPALSLHTSEKIYYSTEVKSLLDSLISPLGTYKEKSYSAPFATRLYTQNLSSSKHTDKKLPGENLQYIDKNLQQSGYQYPWDIMLQITKAAIGSLLVTFVLAGIILYQLHKKRKDSYWKIGKLVLVGQFPVPWRSILITINILTLLFFIAIFLSTKYHILGTDKIGNDIFYISLKSIRTGLIIGSLTTLIMLPLAILLGMVSGYFGGIVDMMVTGVYTVINCIPGVLLIAAALLSVQIYIDNHPTAYSTMAERADTRLLLLCLILGMTSWTSLCRILRAETFKLREIDYVQAAKALGSSSFRILFNHILPNLLPIILITIVLEFSMLILAEATLTYVGVGVDPSTYSWGNVIDNGRLELARDPIVWWPLLSSFVFMFTFVLAINLFADKLRDAFDPTYAISMRIRR